MIAAVSPARSNFEETVGTLRFANSVKEIQTKPSVNQDSDLNVIDQLKKEIAKLKKTGGDGSGGAESLDKDTQEQLVMLQEMQAKFGSRSSIFGVPYSMVVLDLCYVVVWSGGYGEVVCGSDSFGILLFSDRTVV